MAEKRQIEELRMQMAEADLELLRVLERRAKLARSIEQLDDSTLSSVAQAPDRLLQLERAASGDLPVESIRTIFRAIYAEYASLESPPRVAYVGAEGGLGFVAARQALGTKVRTSPAESAAQAFDELIRGRVDFAIAPYENSVEGPMLSTIMALKQTDLVITGQCELGAELSLMNRSGSLTDVVKIYVCANDRAACHNFFNTQFPNTAVQDVRSPAQACQLASEDPQGAAIAHQSLGELKNLSVLLPNVGDQPDLRLRYALIGTRPSPRTGQDVTSIVFTLNDEPGALLSVLNHFAQRGINVKNIISRPAPGEMWDYIFYIDIMGHATDRSLVSALDGIRKNTRFFKVLGSYPAR